ncbi:MAG: heme exporter protein CcmD [Pseudorhodoplanes sp.]|nr:heme exporter protein CcmD [Pseudorhodoplanes sp.]
MAASHAAFILASYLAAFLIVAGMVAWIAFDYRALRRSLAEFDERGLTRRSGRTPTAQ